MRTTCSLPGAKTAMPDAPDTASPLTATLVQTLFPMTSKAVLKQRLPTLLAAMEEFLITTRVRQAMLAMSFALTKTRDLRFAYAKTLCNIACFCSWDLQGPLYFLHQCIRIFGQAMRLPAGIAFRMGAGAVRISKMGKDSSKHLTRMGHVAFVCHILKIFGPIVCLVAIDMIDFMVGGFGAKKGFCNKNMYTTKSCFRADTQYDSAIAP